MCEVAISNSDGEAESFLLPFEVGTGITTQENLESAGNYPGMFRR